MLILCVGIFLLSGCTVDYNIQIDENGMKETANFLFDNSSESKKQINELYKTPLVAYYNMDTNGSFYYNVKKSQKNNNNILTYTYQFRKDQLKNSPFVEGCYYKRNITIEEKYIVLQTDERVTCLFKDGDQLIDELKVNITTKFDVIEHNADSQKGNTYTWNINENNYTNKPIYFKVANEIEKKVSENKNGILILIISIAGISIIAFAIYWIFSKRRERANKI